MVDRFEGDNLVSKKCRDQPFGGRGEGCEKMPGCMKGAGVCVDASKWQCAAQKKILDCLSTRFMAPAFINAPLDRACGKLLMGQGPAKETLSTCKFGVRKGEECETNEAIAPLPDYFAYASPFVVPGGLSCSTVQKRKG